MIHELGNLDFYFRISLIIALLLAVAALKYFGFTTKAFIAIFTAVSAVFVFNQARYARKNIKAAEDDKGARVRPFVGEEGKIRVKNFGKAPAVKFRLMVIKGSIQECNKVYKLDAYEPPFYLEEGEEIILDEGDLNELSHQNDGDYYFLFTYEGKGGTAVPLDLEDSLDWSDDGLISEYNRERARKVPSEKVDFLTN